MQIYIHRDNQQLGPFTEAQIKAQLASGAISIQDHVWWEGQANWMPLGQSPLMATLAAASPGAAPAIPNPLPGATASAQTSTTAPETSKLAVWALVCGCLSLLCSIFTAIPAIILGHMGRSQIKKNPALQGEGMALAGMILGYVFTAFSIVYISIVGISVLIALGNQVKGTFKTIDSQLNAAQGTNSADQSATTPDQTTNAPIQNTPATTNSAPAATNSPDSSTNNSPATSTNSDSSTNAPASTNAAPMSQ